MQLQIRQVRRPRAARSITLPTSSDSTHGKIETYSIDYILTYLARAMLRALLAFLLRLDHHFEVHVQRDHLRGIARRIVADLDAIACITARCWPR